MKLKKIRKIIMDKRLLKEKVNMVNIEYNCGYTDAINDVLIELYRLEFHKKQSNENTSH
jgi:hypothetical protein